MRPTVGKFWMPAKPRDFRWARKEGMERKGSVPQTPARTGVWEMMGRISLAFGLVVSAVVQ